ncbi:MAG TPA: hypothetical protein VMT78_12130 [Terriglobia bacterium]|nr:hypothetical protein [Terriglobia bacterium]HVQ65279.1 hypothetical protein [Terriglobia bacterium]
MNLVISFLLLAFLPPQQTFNRFVYCREFPSGVFEKQCLDLKPDGTGQSRFKRRGSEEASSVLTLSSNGREKFLSVVAATRNLADREKYESKRKVANLGRKHITLEMGSETREAEFNYSDLKEVNTLTTFFDGLINQQVLISDLEMALQYERLSIPERLDQLEGEIKSGRIADPQSLIPVLDKIVQNERVVDYARNHAQQLKSQLLISK